MYCPPMFESLDRKLKEKKSLKEIGKELCGGVKDPRRKALKLVKIHKGEKWLLKNADWLGFNIDQIKNPEGIGSGLKKISPDYGDVQMARHNYCMGRKDISIIPKLIKEAEDELLSEKARKHNKGILLWGELLPNDVKFGFDNIDCWISPCDQDGYHFVTFCNMGHNAYIRNPKLSDAKNDELSLKDRHAYQEGIARGIIDKGIPMVFSVSGLEWTPPDRKWDWHAFKRKRTLRDPIGMWKTDYDKWEERKRLTKLWSKRK